MNGNTNETQDNITCLDAETGKILWQAKEPKLDRGNLILADGLFYAMDASGALVMFKPNKEKYEQVGSAKLLQPKDIWAPMALSDGTLVIRDQRQMKAVVVGK
jgi:outer membrane protein assembly factor BamB